MARGKVAEWIRKRTMPRKSAARRQSKESGASEPILPSEAARESCSNASGGAPAPTPRNAAVSGSGNGAGALPAHSKSRVSAFLSVLMRAAARERAGRAMRAGGVPPDVGGGVCGVGWEALLLPHALRLQAALSSILQLPPSR